MEMLCGEHSFEVGEWENTPVTEEDEQLLEWKTEQCKSMGGNPSTPGGSSCAQSGFVPSTPTLIYPNESVSVDNLVLVVGC